MAGKYEKKKKSPRKRIWPLFLIVVLLAAVVAVLVIRSVLLEKKEEAPAAASTAQVETTAATEAASEATTVPTEPGIGMPYALADGRLEIESVFRYSGANPDCNWEEGSDTGAVVVRNVSDEYLKNLDLTIVLADGTELEFLISDLPAEKTVWAFECQNTTMQADMAVMDIRSTEEFLPDNGLVPDEVQVDVDGIAVTVTNLTEEALTDVVVTCRTVVDDIYFGGSAYGYSIEELPAGGSQTVEAFDCLLGVAEVTLVDQAQ